MNSLENIPALKPPPGIRPNFVNPPSFEHTLVILEGTFCTLMVLAVLARIHVRTKVKAWGWDDYTCVVAACGSLAHMIVYTQMFKIGYGRHLWDFQAVKLLNPRNTRLLSLNGVFYPFTILFAKLSILLLYLRIFDVDRTLRFIIIFGMVFQALFYSAMVGLAIGSIIKCNGPEKLSDPFCEAYSKPVSLSVQVVNVITDIYVLALPIRRVLALQLSGKHKLGLLLVFACGIGTCAASLSRLILFSVHYNDPDVLWIQARNSILTIVEINVAIIVACSSCFRPFFNHTKILSSSVLRSVRSRLVATSSSNSLSKPGGGPIMVGKRERQDKAENWHGGKMISRSDGHLGERSADKFGFVTSVGAKTSTESSAGGTLVRDE